MGGYKKILLLGIILFPTFVYAISFAPFGHPLLGDLVKTVRLGGSWGKHYGHLGEDYDAQPGDSVYAVADGVVEFVKNWPLCDKWENKDGELIKVASSKGWGGVVVIKHDLQDKKTFVTDGLFLEDSDVEENPSVVYSQYGHMTNILVSDGELVKKGEQIGEIGKMCKWVPHLHIEIKDNESLITEILDGVGSGYSGTHDSAPHRFKSISFANANQFLVLEDKENKIADVQKQSDNIIQSPQFSSTLWKTNPATSVFAEGSPLLYSTALEHLTKPKTPNEIPTKDATPSNDSITVSPDQLTTVTSGGTYNLEPVESPNLIQVLTTAQTVELKAVVKNTGTATWKKQDVSVNVVGGKAANASYAHETWFTKLRPALLDQETVQPGQVGTFTFTMTIPPNANNPMSFPLMVVRQDSQNNFYQIGSKQVVFSIEQVDSLPIEETPTGTGGPTEIDDPNFFADIYNETKQVVKKTVKKTTDTVKDVTNDTIEVIKKVPSFFSGGGGSANNTEEHDENLKQPEDGGTNDSDIDIEAPTSTPAEEDNEEQEEDQLGESITILEPDHIPYITNANPIIMVGERTGGVASVSISGFEAEAEYPTSTGWLLRFDLTEGEHTLLVQGKNTANTVVATTSVTYVFDSTAPDVPVVSLTQTGTDPAMIIATWQSSDTLSGVMSYDVERKRIDIEDQDWERVLDDTETTRYEFSAVLGEGYAVRVRVRDRAYNVSLWSGEHEAGDMQYVDYAKEIVINEVNWMGTMSRASGGCNAHEWIELYNPTETMVDVTGWTIEIENKAGQVSVLSPTGTIAPGSFYLLARKASSRSAVLDIPIDTEYQNIVLPNDGARLVLKNAVGDVIDDVHFVVAWPAGTQTGGPNKNFYRSMERVSANLPGSLSSNWRTNQHIPVLGRTNNCGELFGSPRQPNDGSWLLRIPEFYYADLFDSSGVLTLTKAHNPYVLDINGTKITAGHTLRLEPGVAVVGLDQDGYLEISGSLEVNGTSQEPVVFTSNRDVARVGALHWVSAGEPSPGDWSRIQVVGGGTATISNAHVFYGGHPDSKTLTVFNSIEAANVIRNIDSSLIVRDASFFNSFLPVNDQSYGAAIWTESTIGKSANTSISDSVFSGGYYGYKQKGTTVISDISGSTFRDFVGPEGPIVLWNSWSELVDNILQDNAMNSVYVRQISFTSSTSLTSDYSYIVDGLTVQPGVVLTIDPGVELRLTTNSGIEVNGALEANGRGGDPIIVHGHNGAAWNRIVFNNSSSHIEHANISGGNHGPLTSQKGGMILSHNSTLTFSDVSFSTGKMSGNLIEGYNSVLSVLDSNLSFDVLQTDPNFRTAGIYLEGGSATVSRTTFRNMYYGVRALAGAIVSFVEMALEHFVNTISNWWPLDLFTFDPPAPEEEGVPAPEHPLELPGSPPEEEVPLLLDAPEEEQSPSPPEAPPASEDPPQPDDGIFAP